MNYRKPKGEKEVLAVVEQGKMWLVCDNTQYYPSVAAYKTYEEAKQEYDKDVRSKRKYGDNDYIIYLAEVLELE